MSWRRFLHVCFVTDLTMMLVNLWHASRTRILRVYHISAVFWFLSKLTQLEKSFWKQSYFEKIDIWIISMLAQNKQNLGLMINITMTIHSINLKHDYVFMMLSNINLIKGNMMYLWFDLILAELQWINVICTFWVCFCFL